MVLFIYLFVCCYQTYSAESILDQSGLWLIFYTDGPAKQSLHHSQAAFSLFLKAWLCEIESTKADQIVPVSTQVNRKH